MLVNVEVISGCGRFYSDMCCWSVPVFSWFASSVMKYYKLEGETVIEFLCSFSFWWCVKSWLNWVLMLYVDQKMWIVHHILYSCVDCCPDLRLSHFLDNSKSACKIIVGFILIFWSGDVWFVKLDSMFRFLYWATD